MLRAAPPDHPARRVPAERAPDRDGPDLAQRYRVSRAAIGAALARLEQDGLVERLHAQHVRSQFRIILVPGRPPRSVAEHRAIGEAVASRDPDAAEAAMRDHLAALPARRYERTATT